MCMGLLAAAAVPPPPCPRPTVLPRVVGETVPAGWTRRATTWAAGPPPGRGGGPLPPGVLSAAATASWEASRPAATTLTSPTSATRRVVWPAPVPVGLLADIPFVPPGRLGGGGGDDPKSDQTHRGRWRKLGPRYFMDKSTLLGVDLGRVLKRVSLTTSKMVMSSVLLFPVASWGLRRLAVMTPREVRRPQNQTRAVGLFSSFLRL